MAKMALYLREVPQAREFLMEELRFPFNDYEAVDFLPLAATFDSPADRLSLLSNRFGNQAAFAGKLSRIRALLDDRSAAAFLGSASGVSLTPDLLEELEHSGFPPYAIRRFVAEHTPDPHEAGQTRTNADFIGVVSNTTIPGVPEATGTNVTDIVTGGLRSGDGAINRYNIDVVLSNPDRNAAAYGMVSRNNIDAILNNPNRTAQIPTADKIRGIFDSGTEMFGSISGSSISWLASSDWELQGVPGYEESREAFLRGKITGEEWVNRLQQEIPGSADLRDELTTLAFRASVESDPRRAMNLLDESMPHQRFIMDLQRGAPEVMLLVANRFSANGELPEELKEPLRARSLIWSENDPEAYSAMVADLPVGPVRDFLQPPQADEGGVR
jgi:hypothetical protein